MWHARQSPFLLGLLAGSVRTDPEAPEKSRLKQSARRKLGARHCRKTFRHGPRIRAASKPDCAGRIFRGSNLQDRSFSRKRDRAKHSRASIRERDLRTALEHAL